MRDYLEAMEEAERDDAIRVVVTTGTGRTFCVGADLRELVDNLGRPVAELLNDDVIGGEKGLPPLSAKQQQLERFGVGRWAQRLYRLTKPSIAAINGAVAGGGTAIAVAQDYRVASINAVVSYGFLGVGSAPELGLSYRLPRLVGWRVARDFMLENQKLAAADAHAVGLVDVVVEAEDLMDNALRHAHRLAELPDLALRLTKSLLWSAADNQWDEQLRAEYSAQTLLFGLPDTQQLVRKLAEGLSARGTVPSARTTESKEIP